MEFGNLQIDFTYIADPNSVLNELAAKEDRREKNEGHRHDGDDLHLPYWAELWDSTLALCQQLVDQRQFLSGKNLLDLGCGMGLVGTVASALGAHVTLADLESDALLLSRLNAMQFHPDVQGIRLNWRTDRLNQHFDWIVGADIIYERPQWEFLELFWRNHLAPGGIVLIAEPCRPGGDAFPEWIIQKNWHAEVSQQSIPVRQKMIRLIRLTLPNI
jgi:predicted nicotinamide N-methyase